MSQPSSTLQLYARREEQRNPKTDALVEIVIETTQEQDEKITKNAIYEFEQRQTTFWESLRAKHNRGEAVHLLGLRLPDGFFDRVYLGIGSKQMREWDAKRAMIRNYNVDSEMSGNQTNPTSSDRYHSDNTESQESESAEAENDDDSQFHISDEPEPDDDEDYIDEDDDEEMDDEYIDEMR